MVIFSLTPVNNSALVQNNDFAASLTQNFQIEALYPNFMSHCVLCDTDLKLSGEEECYFSNITVQRPQCSCLYNSTLTLIAWPWSLQPQGDTTEWI